MPNLIESKGKTRSPSYYKGGDSASSSKTSKGKASKAPILIGVVAVGAGLVLFMRSKGSSPASNTGPALTVIPSSEADQSTIANMLQALKAVGGLQTTDPNPGGGTSTPITAIVDPANGPSPAGPQAIALSNPNTNYTAPGEVPWTPNSARAWWNNWFANPSPLTNITPQQLPGSFVLSAAEVQKARLINTAFGPAPSGAQGQNAGFRPGDTSVNNSYDLLAYYNQLKNMIPANYVGPNVGVRTDAYGKQLNLDEYYRNLALAAANIKTNQTTYAAQVAAAQAAKVTLGRTG